MASALVCFFILTAAAVRNIRISQVSEWHGNWQKKTRAPPAAAAAAGPQQEGEDLRGMGAYWMTVRVTLGVLSYIVQALNRIPGGL